MVDFGFILPQIGVEARHEVVLFGCAVLQDEGIANVADQHEIVHVVEKTLEGVEPKALIVKNKKYVD